MRSEAISLFLRNNGTRGPTGVKLTAATRAFFGALCRKIDLHFTAFAETGLSPGETHCDALLGPGVIKFG